MAQTQLTSIPIVMIIVCVVLGLNLLLGALRGFVRKISGIAAFFLAGILVTTLLPPVTSWLHTTPVYPFVVEQCEKIGANLVQNSISGALNAVGGEGILQGNGDATSVIDAVRADDGSGRLDREKIKAQLQAMGYDASVIDSMSDDELEGYAQQLAGFSVGMIGPPGLLHIESVGAFFLTGMTIQESQTLQADTSSAQNGKNLLSELTAGMDRVEQTRFIEDLPLPQSIKDQIETFNNENGYLKLGASDFGSYIVHYIASLIMNILAYVVTLLAAWIIIRIVLGALSVFRYLPIVGTADHLLGLVLGLIQGALTVWGLFLILSLFSTTQIGTALMQEIYASKFLSFLYNTNPFLNSAAGAIKGIM